MRRLSYARCFMSALAAVAMLIAPSSIMAITYGFVDTTDSFGNVGAFIVRSPTAGEIFPICSGTLIAPDVFLTASHCTVFFTDVLAPLGFKAFISFDNPIPFGDLTSRKTRLIPADRSGVLLVDCSKYD